MSPLITLRLRARLDLLVLLLYLPDIEDTGRGPLRKTTHNDRVTST